MTRYSFLLFALAMAFMMTGCGVAIVGGSAYSGYRGGTDERTIGTMLDDSVLSTTVKSKMIADEFVKARNIDVDVLNSVVFLIGVVESTSQKRMAADIVRGVEGVKRVENQLIVGKTTTAQVLNDTFLTSKIKTELLKAPDIRSSNIDVDTHNNVVTLTGILKTRQEKNEALYIVKTVVGNREIVDNLSVSN